MWLLFALLAGLMFTSQGLLARHVLKGEKDAWAYSFYFSFIGALVTFPFMVHSPSIPLTWIPWALCLLMGIVIVGHNLLIFKSTNHLEASISGAVSQVKLVWIFLLGILLAQELFTWEKLIGMLLTVLAGVIIVGKVKRPHLSLGIWLLLASTILNAAIIILFKYLFIYFNSASATFFAAFLAPAILNFIIMPNAQARVKKIIKTDGKMIILACTLGALANLALTEALLLGESTKVMVMLEAFLLITLVCEHLFLKEKNHLLIKTIAVVLAIAGAILIRLSS